MIALVLILPLLKHQFRFASNLFFRWKLVRPVATFHQGSPALRPRMLSRLL